MSRPSPTFADKFQELAGSLGFTIAQVTANTALDDKLVSAWNRAYKKCYNRFPWEDAWQAVTVTPSSRLITHAAISNACRFEVWSADPRDPGNNAFRLRHQTASAGVLLLDDAAEAVVLYYPRAPKFTRSAYNAGTTYALGALVLGSDGIVYESLQASNLNHTPASSPTYWQAVPVLEVFADAVLGYARGTYLIEAGQVEAGAAARADANGELESIAMNESARQSASSWQPEP